jgi:hypothetical protein
MHATDDSLLLSYGLCTVHCSDDEHEDCQLRGDLDFTERLFQVCTNDVTLYYKCTSQHIALKCESRLTHNSSV